jgi:hypothetical protein
LRTLRRELVHQLSPFGFDHGSHLIREVVDAFDFEHLFVGALSEAGGVIRDLRSVYFLVTARIPRRSVISTDTLRISLVLEVSSHDQERE